MAQIAEADLSNARITDFVASATEARTVDGSQPINEAVEVDADDIKRDVLAPILRSDDIESDFAHGRDQYRTWRDKTVADIERNATIKGSGIDDVTALEDAMHESIKNMLHDSREILGQRAVKVLEETIKLKVLVRDVTITHSKNWPQNSWDYIVDKFVDVELCLAGVLYHIATGIGRAENVWTLSRWSLDCVLDAYNEAGRTSPDAGTVRGERDASG